MDTLRPITDFDGSKPLLALDNDNVLNVYPDDDGTPQLPGTTRRRVRTAHGTHFFIDFREELIDGLNELVSAGAVELGWATTWGPNVRALVEQAFDGRLAGGFVLVKMPPKLRGRRPEDWKMAGLRNRVALTGQSWVWVDDEEVPIARDRFNLAGDPVLSAVPGLAIGTDPVLGMSDAELDQVRAFVAGR